MDLNPNLDLRCPNCDIKIEQRVQKKMNRFWVGLQTTNCEGCYKVIQWHSSLHKKIKLGGNIFRVGILFTLLSLLPFMMSWKPYGSLLLSFGLLLITIGILVTHTPNDRIKVEIVNEA